MMIILDQKAEENKTFMENVETEDLQLEEAQCRKEKMAFLRSLFEIFLSPLEICLKSLPSFSSA